MEFTKSGHVRHTFLHAVDYLSKVTQWEKVVNSAQAAELE